MSLSKQIQNLMATKSLSMSAVAKKAGVSYQSFAQVAKGKSLPNARCLGRYAKLLGMKPAALAEAIQEERGKSNKPGPGRPAKRSAAKPAKKVARKPQQ